MSRESLAVELADLMSDVLDLDPANIGPDSGPDNIESWDSLAHIRLIAAIEETYGLTIPPEDQVDMLTFDLIVDVVAEKRSIVA